MSARSYILRFLSSWRRSTRMDMTESRSSPVSASSGRMARTESNSFSRPIQARAVPEVMARSAMALLDSVAISNMTPMASRVLKSLSMASVNFFLKESTSASSAGPSGAVRT